MTSPWERQKGESAKAFEAFRVYLDMGGTRSVSRVAQELTKSGSLLRRWSVRWSWQDRLAAWDSELSRRALDAESEARREMAQRHARFDQLVLSKLAQRLVGDPANGIAPLDVNTISWAELRGLMESSQKLERLARGESTENVDVRQSARDEVLRLAVDQGLSDDETQAALEEVDKLIGRSRP